MLLVLVVAHFCKLTKQYVGGVSGCELQAAGDITGPSQPQRSPS